MIRSIYLLFLLAIPFVSFSQIQPTKTGKVKTEIQKARTQGATFQKTKLFRSLKTTETDALKKHNNNVKDAVYFDFVKPANFNAEAKKSSHLSLDIPTTGKQKSLTIDLIQVDIFSGDFKSNVDVSKGAHYRGVVRGRDKSLVALSVFENEVIGLVSIEGEILTLGKVKGEEKTHVLYNEFKQGWGLSTDCSTDDSNISFKPEDIENAAMVEAPNDCIREKFEVDESLTNQLGGVTQATNYGTGIFNNQKTLYANDGINVVLSELKVWTNADPAPYVLDEYNTLDSYRALTGSYNGDVAYLGFYQGGWGGGVASSIGGICTQDVDDTKAIGGHYGSYSNVPTYSHDVMIISHEMGHIFGARHTHACVWNGNNTAIDGCAGFTEGGCQVPNNVPSAGTIMSYCNTNDFNEGFHPQVATAIQNYIASRTCTNPCSGNPTCSDGIQNGNETGVDCGGPDCDPCTTAPTCTDGIQNGNETGVDCGGPDCDPCTTALTCSDGIQNGNETGVDCGGPDCDPCVVNPCTENVATLTILFDDYASETSWNIMDDNGSTVASSNGTYSQSENGTTGIFPSCLEDGCYTFTINDTYGDGICCAYGEGSYSLLDAAGNVLASGGEFEFTETTEFCVGGQGPAPTYCETAGLNTNYEWIDRVMFGTIDNTSGDDGGYGDYTNVSGMFTQGETVDVALYPGFSNSVYPEYWRVWIDYNQDGDFDDVDELVGEGNGTSMISGTSDIPSMAIPGMTRMRVAMRYNAYPESSCGTFEWGEVEDYTIEINAAYNLGGDVSNGKSKLTGENSDMGLNLFPNPAKNEVSMSYLARTAGEAELQILDMTGKVVSIQKEDVRKGTNVFQLNTSELPSGIYLVRFNKGEYQVAEKLTISK